MLKLQRIVNSTLLGLCCLPLMGCGQKGPLYLPTAPEAAGRATLPETLRGPVLPRRAAPASAPAVAASAPVAPASTGVAPAIAR